VIVTVNISPASIANQKRHQTRADGFPAAVGRAVGSAVSVGADALAELTLKGQLGVTPQRGAMGLAGSILGWMIDAGAGLGAIGVPANTPAGKYAAILNYGGTILPRTAKRLAIPITEEAKRYSSPRDMPGLVLVTREGKAPLLVQMVGKVMSPQWVLLSSVTIPAFGWWDKGVGLVTPTIANEFITVLRKAS
jgi:hypothetical protein